MITTILADDDKMALEYLESLINWESYGFKIVGRALDGDEAFKLYKKHLPQLIITDLRMPAMDGIALAEKVRQQDMDTRIIFLSGYTEFEYVRAALHMGVEDYILKHELDEKILLEKLISIRRDLRSDDYGAQLAFGKIIVDYLERNSDLSEYQDNAVSKLLQRQYQVILIEADDILPPLSKYIPPKAPVKFLKEIICGFSSEYGVQAIPIKIKTSLYLIMIQAEFNASFLKARNDIYVYARALQKHVNYQTNTYFSMVLLPQLTKPKELKDHWINLNDSMAASRFDSTHFCTFFDEAPKPKNIGQSVSISEIEAALMSGDTDKLSKMLESQTQTFRSNYDINSASYFCTGTLELLKCKESTIIDLETSKCVSLPMLGGGAGNELKEKGKTWSVLTEWISNQLICLSSVIKNNQQLSYPASVLQAIEYIKDNYSRTELSVEEIAEHVGKGRNRLGLLFKEKTNHTISDYLTWFRIQKSLEMIKKGSYKMYEIAALSGYTTSQYFSKVFKKVMGVTPYEYKREWENGG